MSDAVINVLLFNWILRQKEIDSKIRRVLRWSDCYAGILSLNENEEQCSL